jgi:hypothetical protein
MNTDRPSNVIYHEVQYFRQRWVLILILAAAGIAWYGFILQIFLGQAFGENPAPDWAIWIIWILVGIGLPTLFYISKLIIDVDRMYIHIHLIPFTEKKIALDDILLAEARKYNPIREFGGWGVRWGFGNTRAYNISGDQGVELELKNGQKIMIGSQRSEKLSKVISRLIN